MVSSVTRRGPWPLTCQRAAQLHVVHVPCCRALRGCVGNPPIVPDRLRLVSNVAFVSVLQPTVTYLRGREPVTVPSIKQGKLHVSPCSCERTSPLVPLLCYRRRERVIGETCTVAVFPLASEPRSSRFRNAPVVVCHDRDFPASVSTVTESAGRGRRLQRNRSPSRVLPAMSSSSVTIEIVPLATPDRDRQRAARSRVVLISRSFVGNGVRPPRRSRIHHHGGRARGAL